MAIKATLKKGKGPLPTVTAPQPVTDIESTTTNLEDAVAGENNEAPGEATSRAVATRPTNTAVARNTEPDGSGFEGEWGADDLKFPQLKMVQGSGKLSKEFNVGTVIYGNEELFAPVNKKQNEAPHLLRFIPLAVRKQFREKLSQDAYQEGQQARIADSIAEVEDCGGTTRWHGDTMPDNYWEASSRNLFLIEKPEDCDHPGFALDLDGKQYGVAVYYAAGAAFRASAQVIYNLSKTSLFVPVLDTEGKPTFNGRMPIKKALIYKCVWTISWDMASSGKFTPYRPTVRLLKEETGPDVRGYCNDLLTGGQVEEAASE